MDYSGQNMDMVTFVLFYTLVMSQWWMKTQKNVTTLVILWPVDGQYLLDRLSMIPQKVHDNGMYLWSKSVATAPILFLGRKCETCHCCKYQNPTFNISISLYARQATIIYASKRQTIWYLAFGLTFIAKYLAGKAKTELRLGEGM